mgnify:CR=1 FL=1
MSSSFGTPLSSIPNTSYKNLSSPVSYTGSTGMDPLIGASLISAGGSAIAGGASASGSKKAADKAKSAAEAQAEAIEKASREAPLIGFGMEAAGKQYDAYKGGPMDRLKAFEDAKLEGALAFSPNALARQRLQLSRELAGIRQQAYGKEMDPFSRFI